MGYWVLLCYAGMTGCGTWGLLVGPGRERVGFLSAALVFAAATIVLMWKMGAL
jgi:hypothetical protein